MRFLLLTAALGICISCAKTPSTSFSLSCPHGSMARTSDSSTWCEVASGSDVGFALSWHEAGRIQSVSHLRAGKSVSIVLFYETGEVAGIRSQNLETGREISRHWYRDGTRKLYAEWQNGRLNGRFRSWYPNGEPKSEGAFSNGAHLGTWKFWGAEDGREQTVEYPAAQGASNSH